MSDIKRAVVHRAQGVHGTDDIPAGLISINLSIPDDHRIATLDTFRGDAQEILDVLNATLPGGTLDQLFALMAADKASVLKVARHSSPKPGDVVIDEPPVGSKIVDREGDVWTRLDAGWQMPGRVDAMWGSIPARIDVAWGSVSNYAPLALVSTP